MKIAGKPLDMGKTYTVAMPVPLADGALSYYTIWSKSAIDKGRASSRTLRDAIAVYVSSKKTIGEPAEPRLNFKK